MFCVSNKILKIDLEKEKTLNVTVDDSILRQYIGGCSLGAKFLYEEVPPTIEWSDPQNCLIILGGQLSGTKIPGSGGFNISTKGAMTNGAAATQAQGVFGAYLRLCGLLGLIISGASSNWCYLVINEDGTADFRSAEHLIGKDTWDTVDEIAKELGKKERELSILSIGPAGENLIRFANITADKGHVAAHNGVGAVMGSKKLKAIVVVRAKNSVEVKDKVLVSSIVKKILKPLIENRSGHHYYGTLSGFHKNYSNWNLPIMNYTKTRWQIPDDKFQKFSGPYIYDNYSPKRTRLCWGCPNHHSTVLTIPDGPYEGTEIEEPDYEQLAALGSNLGIEDLTTVMILANLVDRLGMDVNETGWSLSCIIECFEKGIVTANQTGGLELKWGDAAVVKEVIQKIASREGIGDILAEGVMRAVKKIGNGAEEIGIYTKKGVTPRSHDHRARWTELFDNCVSESGTLDSTPVGTDIKKYGVQSGIEPRTFDPNGIVEMEVKIKGGMQLEDSLVTCRFNTRMSVDLLVEAVRAVTGWVFTAQEAMDVGRRAVNLMHVFNMRSGLTSDLNWPSSRYGSSPVDGPGAGKSIFLHLEKMLKDYYRDMGWDENGKPLPETLKRLQIEWIESDL